MLFLLTVPRTLLRNMILKQLKALIGPTLATEVAFAGTLYLPEQATGNEGRPCLDSGLIFCDSQSPLMAQVW